MGKRSEPYTIMTITRLQNIFSFTSFLCIFVFLSTGMAADPFPDKASIRYAKGFTVEYYNTHKLLTVSDPWKDARQTFQYVLVPRGNPRPQGYKPSQYIEIPLRSIVTMSTTYLGQLRDLGELDTLIGHSNFKHVNTVEAVKMIDEGKIQEVGEGASVNVELLMDLSPDLIMTYGLGNVYDSHSKLLEAELPTVINAAYMEQTPLGRAEWLKFIALFYDKEAEAEKIFTATENSYHRLRNKAEQYADRPTVLLNAPFNGKWWVAGGQGYVAAFLKDAGARYLWEDIPSSGSQVVDFEVVYERAIDADFWLNPGQWKSLKDGMRSDERLTEFRAFQEGRIYNNNARVNEYGGNDYWESGTTHPDLILSDLIEIFHPELLPDHELVYYQKLE